MYTFQQRCVTRNRVIVINTQFHTWVTMFPGYHAKVGEADMWSQVNINTCTDANTHAKVGSGTRNGESGGQVYIS